MDKKAKGMMGWVSSTGEPRNGPLPVLDKHPKLAAIIADLRLFAEAKASGGTRLGWRKMIDEYLTPEYGISITPSSLKIYLRKYHGFTKEV